MGHFIHKEFALPHEQGGYGMGGLGVVSLGLDHQYPGIVVEIDTHPGKVVAMEPFHGGVLKPHARQRIAMPVAVVAAQVQGGVEFVEHVHRQQVVAQQQLVCPAAAAAEQTSEIQGRVAGQIGPLDDDVGFGNVTVRGNRQPIDGSQQGDDDGCADDAAAQQGRGHFFMQPTEEMCGKLPDPGFFELSDHPVGFSLYACSASSIRSNQCALPL